MQKEPKMETKQLATINKVAIVASNDSDELIPIRPICEALGIDYSTQHSKIKSHYLWSSVMGKIPTTGSDGKEYKMACLPIEYIFGWLLSINAENVKPEVQDQVKKYQIECHHALYLHFVEAKKFLKEKETAVAEMMKIKTKVRKEFNEARNVMNAAERQLAAISAMTIEDWRNDKYFFDSPFQFELKEGGKNEK